MEIIPVPKRREDSLLEYIGYFEQVMGANGWTNEQVLRFFQACWRLGPMYWMTLITQRGAVLL